MKMSTEECQVDDTQVDERTAIMEVTTKLDAAKENADLMKALIRELMSDPALFNTYIASENFIRLLDETLPQHAVVVTLIHAAALLPEFRSLIKRLLGSDERHLPAVFIRQVQLVFSCLLTSDDTLSEKEYFMHKLCTKLLEGWNTKEKQCNDVLAALEYLILSEMSRLMTKTVVESAVIETLLLICSTQKGDTSFDKVDKTRAQKIVLVIVSQSDAQIELYNALQQMVIRLLATGIEREMANACCIVQFLCTVNGPLGTNILGLEGFLEEVLAESEDYPQVNYSMLSMLSAACATDSCRQLVSAKCSSMLVAHLQDPTDQISFLQTIIIYYKLNQVKSALDLESRKRMGSVILSFLQNPESTELAVEALMFFSLDHQTKSMLVDSGLLMKGIQGISEEIWPKVAYAVAIIIDNLTQLPNIGSDEEERFKEMAASTTSGGNDDRASPETMEKVLSRITDLIDQALIQLVNRLLIWKNHRLQPLLVEIIKSVASVSKARVALVQIGAVKYLCATLSETKEMATVQFTAGHALAKILISVDPNVVFNPARLPIVTAITALLNVLERDALEPIAQFEILLALTNLSSVGEFECQKIIKSWKTVESLLLSGHDSLQRASMELICNLVASEAGQSLFLASRSSMRQHLKLIVALAENKDFPTQRAASGALAVLTDLDIVCQYLLEGDSHRQVILNLVRNQSEEIIHRGLVILLNLSYKDVTTSYFATADFEATIFHLSATAKGSEVRSIAKDIAAAVYHIQT